MTSPLQDRMIFAFGVQRSGTYWLQRILAAHPEVSSLPSETQLFYRGIDRLHEVFHHGSRGSPTAGEMFVERDELLDATRDFCDRVLAPYLEPGSRYLAERTSSHVYSVRNIAAVYPDARLVHIIRDGRDVARSQVAQEWGPATITEAAEQWRSGIVGARAAAPEDRYLEVRYEEMLADPAEQIERIYSWLELTTATEVMDAALSEARLSRNEDLSDGRLASGKWRDHFSEEDLASFMDVGGDLLAELGYEVEAASPPRRPPRARRLARRLLPRADPAPGGVGLPDAQRVVDGVVEAMNIGDYGRLEDLLTPDFRAIVIGAGQGERRLDGAEALIAWLRDDDVGASTQLRAHPHPGLPSYSLVQSLRLPDGNVEDRVLAFVMREARVEVLTIYRFPLA